MARVRVQVPVDQTPVEESAPTTAGEAEVVPVTERRPNLFTKNRLLIVGGLAVLMLVIFMVISLMNDRKHLKAQVNKLETSQSSSTINDAQKYQSIVEKVIDVPAGITPVAKTLTGAEVSQLGQDNPIYKSAKDGDVFLLYTYPDKSLFLVIYRPSTQKVVLATLGTQQTTQTPTKP